MNFPKPSRRMNEPVGPSPDLIRKTLSHPDRHRLPLRRLAAAAAAAAVLLATGAAFFALSWLLLRRGLIRPAK